MPASNMIYELSLWEILMCASAGDIKDASWPSLLLDPNIQNFLFSLFKKTPRTSGWFQILFALRDVLFQKHDVTDKWLCLLVL